MIKVRCETNIDFCKSLSWPTELPVLPSIGHVIVANSIDYVELEVTGIRWEYVKKRTFDGDIDNWMPVLVLSIPSYLKMTLQSFIDTYGPKDFSYDF